MAVQVGQSNLIFGVTDQTYGYFESMEVNETVNETNVTDGGGDLVGASFHGKVFEVSGTYVFRATANAPAGVVGVNTGIKFTFGGDSDFPLSASDVVYITSAKTSYSSEDYKKVDFEGKYYPDFP